MLFKKTKFTKKAIAVMLSGSMLLGFSGCSSDNNSQQNNNTNNIATAQSINYGLTENVKDGAILHAFCWDFKTIQENLSDIAAAGYTGVQVVCIQSCVDPNGNALSAVDGSKGMWYYFYQPTDFKIGNYVVGSRDEFKEMCTEADKYGIKIIVDVCPNHTGTSSAVADDLKNAVGGVDKLYHPNGFTSVKNYGNRLECTTYASGGLSDIDTENDSYQDYFIEFLNDCIECGADGFRYDSAKHIGLPDDPQANSDEENDFWPRVTSDEITNRSDMFIYGEVLQGDNERSTEYVKYLDAVTASSYGNSVRGIANNKSVEAKKLTDFNSGVSSDQLVTWVESHDNYINDGTYKIIDNEEVAFAWAVISASGKGTPLFFNRPVGSSSDKWYGTLNLVGYKGDENYKHPYVVASNRFRNAMVGEDTNPINIDDKSKVLMVERGDKGVALFSGLTEDFSVSCATKLADGTYTDRAGVNGDFTVSGGTLTGTIAAGTIAILYNDGYIEVPETPTVSCSATAILGDDYEVTLSATNAASAQYSIITADEDGNFNQHDAEKIDYKDGDVIKLGTGIETGESVILKLYATNSDGITVTKASRLYKKDIVKAGDSISFVSNKAWASTVYAYIYTYDANGEKVEIAPWPGVAMTKTEGFLYTYKFESDLTNEGFVIFNDGGDNQRPSKKGSEGLEIQKDKQYS